jgi:hypothetical protein
MPAGTKASSTAFEQVTPASASRIAPPANSISRTLATAETPVLDEQKPGTIVNGSRANGQSDGRAHDPRAPGG